MSWQVVGHGRAVRALQRAVADDAPAHAYLITGPEHVGKRALARELAAALNCDAAPAERPCHACRTCHMIDRELHPDFVIIERSEDKRAVSIKQVRDARGEVAWKPYQGRYKVYVFLDADEMAEESANAFLLTLEEPPPRVVFVLTARQPESLLPTVQSRCRQLALQPVPATELADMLGAEYGADKERAERLAGLAQGRPGWAIRALDDPELERQRSAEVERAVALSHGALGARLILAGEVCKGESFNDSRAACLRTLDDMLVWWRDMLLIGSDPAAAVAHVDRREELARQATSRGRSRISRGLRDIELTAGMVERNVTPRLALEALLLRLG